jgi:APA family basic amino acid/polyamine antiporter
MTSIGTLFAFVLVCGGILVMRKTHPDLPRPFKTPLVPVVPVLGVLVNLGLMAGLGWSNWLRLFVWMGLGLAIYFGYGTGHRAGCAASPLTAVAGSARSSACR